MGGTRVIDCCVKYGEYVGFCVGGGVHACGLQLYVTCCVWAYMGTGTF